MLEGFDFLLLRKPLNCSLIPKYHSNISWNDFILCDSILNLLVLQYPFLPLAGNYLHVKHNLLSSNYILTRTTKVLLEHYQGLFEDTSLAVSDSLPTKKIIQRYYLDYYQENYYSANKAILYEK